MSNRLLSFDSLANEKIRTVLLVAAKNKGLLSNFVDLAGVCLFLGNEIKINCYKVLWVEKPLFGLNKE